MYKQNHGYDEEVYILPEIVYNQNLCIYFSKHSCLVRRVEYILLNLRSMGLIFHWSQRSMRYSGKGSTTRNNSNEPLDFEELSGIFFCTAFGLIASCLAFMCELIIWRCTHKKRKRRARRNITANYAGRWYNFFSDNYEISGERIIAHLIRSNGKS